MSKSEQVGELYKLDIDPLNEKLRTIQRLFDYLMNNRLESSFVSRGNPTAYDFTLSDFTTDGTWKIGSSALDLSSIVDSDAKAVLLNIAIIDDAINKSLILRKSGSDNNYSQGVITTQVANQIIYSDVVIEYNSDQKIEYQCSNTTFSGIYVVVKGWWK